MANPEPSLPQSFEELASMGLEDLGGLFLEMLVREGKQHVSNFASSIASRYQNADKDQLDRVVREGWQWLESKGLIVPSGQSPGLCIVTRLGQSIGTAANLKRDLAKQRAPADAEYERARAEIAEMKARIKVESDAVMQEAKTEVATILALARQTASGVSLDQVQEQFSDAAAECLRRLKLWAKLSGASIVAFFTVLVLFVTWWAPSFQADPKVQGFISANVIYSTIIRVTALTAIAALATFCLRVLRAQMHLREHNLHRKRVANSTAAFLGASSPEQRDVVLIRMVDSITSFGTSGLLTDGDDSMSPAKVILESVPRSQAQN